MKTFYAYLTVVLSSILLNAESARILAVVPFPSKSHQAVIQPLLMELAKRDHQVTCLTAYPPPDAPTNYRAIKMDNYIQTYKKQSGPDIWRKIHSLVESLLFPIYFVLFKEFGLRFTEWAVQQPQVKQLIESDEEFDVVVMETSLFQEAFIALGHRFKAHVVEIVPTSNVHWSYWVHGNPFDTSYIGDISVDYSDRMSFAQRLTNTMISGLFRFFSYHYVLPKHQKIMDQHLIYDGWRTRPSVMDMLCNTSLVLVNSHFSFNYPQPFAPHVKQVGGLNIVPTHSLPKELQRFMDEAKDGIILFGFGSSIGVSSMLSHELRKTFAKAFTNLKQRVLWKWEKEFEDAPSNVLLRKWFPQQAILNDNRTRVIISHGGQLSFLEAIYYGVPHLVIPLVGDGYRNAQIVKLYNCGIYLSFDNITLDSIRWALDELINNPIYAENAKKRSKLFRDKPETALETAVYWTEYVIRHKGAHHLRPAIATMPWYQQAMIDVYLVLALIVLIPTYITYRTVKCFMNYLCSKKTKSTSNKKKKKE